MITLRVNGRKVKEICGGNHESTIATCKYALAHKKLQVGEALLIETE